MRVLRLGGGAAGREPADDGAGVSVVSGERRGDQCAGHAECVLVGYGVEEQKENEGRERAASAVLSRTSGAKVPRHD